MFNDYLSINFSFPGIVVFEKYINHNYLKGHNLNNLKERMIRPHWPGKRETKGKPLERLREISEKWQWRRSESCA